MDVNPISITAVVGLLDLWGIKGYDRRNEVFDVVRELDGIFMNHIHDERKRKDREGKRKGRGKSKEKKEVGRR